MVGKTTAQLLSEITSSFPNNTAGLITPLVLRTFEDDSVNAPINTADINFFNVKSYGAVGDGVTDDTAAINSAIAAFNTAGIGNLFFPATANAYLVTASLTTITAVGLVSGQGSSNLNDLSTGVPASQINCNSTTAVVFTCNTPNLTFRDLSIVNTAGTTPTSASAGIVTTFATAQPRVNYFNCYVASFYINVDVQVGNYWTMDSCLISYPVQYGMCIRNTVNTDAGDWCISNCSFTATNNSSSAGIFQSGSGGGKIVNTKFNSTGQQGWNDCINSTLTLTSDLLVSNCSFENFTNTALNLTSITNGLFDNLQIFYTNNVNGDAILTNSITNCTFSNITSNATNAGVYVFKFRTSATRTGVKNIICAGLTEGVIDPASDPINFAEEGYFRVGSDVPNSTAVLATATGLSAILFGPNSSGLSQTYGFEAYLPYTCAAAGGIQVAMVGDGSLADNLIHYDGFIIDSGANGIKGNAASTSLGGVVASATTTGTAGVVIVKGTIAATVSGTISVQFAQNTSNGTATTIKAGAWFKFWRVPLAD